MKKHMNEWIYFSSIWISILNNSTQYFMAFKIYTSFFFFILQIHTHSLQILTNIIIFDQYLHIHSYVHYTYVCSFFYCNFFLKINLKTTSGNSKKKKNNVLKLKFCSYFMFFSFFFLFIKTKTNSKGIIKGDEIMVINGAIVSDLDMMYLESVLQEEQSLSMMMR